MAIVLKITLGDDTRRISLDRAPSYDELTQLIKQLFGMSGTYTLKYQDEDKDLITVTSQAELSEAFNIATQHFSNVLRLFVSASESKPKSSTSSPIDLTFLHNIINQLSLNNMEGFADRISNITLNGHPFDGKLLSQLLSNPAIQNILAQLGLSASISNTPPPPPAAATNGEVPIHFGVTCDGCEAHPIMGTRFKCTVCADYDLCAVCQAKGDVHSHPMRQIDAPAPRTGPHHGFRGCPRRGMGRWGACTRNQAQEQSSTTTTSTTTPPTPSEPAPSPVIPTPTPAPTPAAEPQATPSPASVSQKRVEELIQKEKEKLEADRIQAEKFKREEEERLEKEMQLREIERIAALERAEAERKKEEAEKLRLLQLEAERIEAEKLRIEYERVEEERRRILQQEKERIQAERKKKEEADALLPTAAESASITQLTEMGFTGDLLAVLRSNRGQVDLAIAQLLN